MPIRRSLILSAATVVTPLVAAATLGGAPFAGAQVAGLPPGVTLPARVPGSTTTTAPAASAPATVAPATTSPPPSSQILSTTTTPTSTTAPANQTRILPGPQPTTAEPAAKPAPPLTEPSTTATTVKPANQPPPPSLSPGQVDDVLRAMARSGANSTATLLDALKPLQDLGMSLPEAAALVMGPFPVLGLANWTDDFGDYRAGPPVHSHQGNDLFTQFGTPVRAPSDGTVRFGDEGLGGLVAYVTAADGTYYYMAHLKGFATDLSSGSAVKQGRVVGFAGDTGNARGGAPHVHFEIHPGGGAAVNPKPIVDGWVAAALARIPDVVASMRPPATAAAPAEVAADPDAVIPQILVTTGLTRRFSPLPRAGAGPDPAAATVNPGASSPVSTPGSVPPLAD